jgi:hypothetical protein
MGRRATAIAGLATDPLATAEPAAAAMAGPPCQPWAV